jgi:hypothetical protein
MKTNQERRDHWREVMDACSVASKDLIVALLDDVEEGAAAAAVLRKELEQANGIVEAQSKELRAIKAALDESFPTQTNLPYDDRIKLAGIDRDSVWSARAQRDESRLKARGAEDNLQIAEKKLADLESRIVSATPMLPSKADVAVRLEGLIRAVAMGRDEIASRECTIDKLKTRGKSLKFDQTVDGALRLANLFTHDLALPTALESELVLAGAIQWLCIHAGLAEAACGGAVPLPAPEASDGSTRHTVDPFGGPAPIDGRRFRRGSAWAPPKVPQPCFLAVAPDGEWCICCTKHVSRHFGRGEYRCQDADEREWQRRAEAFESFLRSKGYDPKNLY